MGNICCVIIVTPVMAGHHRIGGNDIMAEFIHVHTTTNSREEAQKIAETVVANLNQTMPQPTFEGLLQLPGVALFVRQFGTAGPPVILIHGGPDWDQSYFFPFLAPLARSCRLIAFDIRGCVRSQKFGDPPRYHIYLVVQDLAYLLATLHFLLGIPPGFSYAD